MPITAADHEPMRQAIEASREAVAEGNMPFGATLVSPEGSLLWTARNNQITRGDCTGHAELVLVREATAKLGADALRGGTVYASGEPCAMCSGAMFWAGIRRVVFAASQQDIIDALGGEQLPIRSAQVYAGASPAVQVDGPLLGSSAIEVLREAGRRLSR
ncbi:MAG TPA: nucleoside deaminase [Piscinibacter sp.]|jgi:tRNA(adenine34) deaminase|uniref:nucleoside deaminase n=1 Tax=Piscinibacter sp. TaxID=1903157 RepID=UPI001B668A46|nr:nucleoside deaminase [Piscinibacter sp.]MBK7531389.1 nucleoside deaminase [Piscinibacter sp.]MBL0093816.1 nucleoside deaminase [Piscinibacter sp.]MBP6543233.1 nucleoside deaminase [Piscinibacter sp.]HOY36451.1 nucleoside deaminase [Piscinibacter sp.]HPG79147.1 nucleoside deaminase [Piscinibacter sp.]